MLRAFKLGKAAKVEGENRDWSRVDKQVMRSAYWNRGSAKYSVKEKERENLGCLDPSRGTKWIWTGR